MKKRILCLTKYSRLAASSRLRTYQYVPWLEQAGWTVRVRYLFSDGYVRALREGKRSLWRACAAYVRRVLDLGRVDGVGVVWVEKEALPWMPVALERGLLCGRRWALVLDYDDAVFHWYELLTCRMARRFLAGKHAELMRLASLVFVGSSHIEQYARRRGVTRVVRVPTVVDLSRYPCVGGQLSDGSMCERPIDVVWIGQRASARYLIGLREMMAKLSREGVARFIAIGINAADYGLPMISKAWSEETEVARLKAADVGIMPLPDAEFERGKCGYKLIQYMACGLPVVASPVGENTRIVRPGVNGLLARTTEEWEAALRLLAGSARLREEFGRAGRALVEQSYSLDVWGPRVVRMLEEIARGQL